MHRQMVQSVRRACEHVFVRWESQTVEPRTTGRLPATRRGRGAALRRSRGARHPLPRGPHEVGAQPRPGHSGAVQLDGQPLPGLHPRLPYCFARPTHEYLELDAGRDFEREIVVKVNVPEVLRAELARPSWKGEHVALGTNTDPYQWVEGRYKLMRGIWEAMRDAANPCSILTKSPLLLRDLDLLKEIAAVTDVSACLSVPTLDEKAWRATEPHTPHPRARLEAVAELNRAGIPTGVLIAPLMPGINDAPEQVRADRRRCATEAGATYIGGQTLFLRGSVRDVFFDWLREHRPDLVRALRAAVRQGRYLSAAERQDRARRRRALGAADRTRSAIRHRGAAARVRAPRRAGARREPV